MQRFPITVTAALSLLLVAFFSPATGRAQSVDPQVLVGIWQVDLRPTPDAEPYFQQFEVRSVTDGVLSGTFYGTEVLEGRVNTDWGAVHFAFVTEDGSGAYNTSGVLRDGRLAGRTHALGRDFLAVWSAEHDDGETGGEGAAADSKD